MRKCLQSCSHGWPVGSTPSLFGNTARAGAVDSQGTKTAMADASMACFSGGIASLQGLLCSSRGRSCSQYNVENAAVKMRSKLWSFWSRIEHGRSADGWLGKAPGGRGGGGTPRLGFCRCQAAGIDALVALHQSAVLGVGVGLPCTVMECGDVVYRSTLPQQGFQITPPGVALTLLIVAYLWSTPGVAPGFWDMFVLAPLEQLLRPSFRKEDFVLGKKLGEGAFGTVYKASLSNPNLLKNSGPLVVKKANEYGAVEVWMNERVRRACRNSCADFVHGFLESNPNKKGDEFWLVWRYEGKETLADLMANKDFPYNVEEVMLGMANVDDLPKGPERENRIIGRIMRQILNSLYQLHATGIVHRDIKPQNIIFSDDSKVFKIIDLGAAADLRVGINYAPKEFLLDPRYAAPEQYIMSTQTPSAPPVLVAALLSPVLWQMNFPDHFDVYSAGLIFLQMVFPNLRSDSGLITFNRQFKRRGYDIKSWRELVEAKPNQDIRHGFEILDLDGGVAWELLQAMVRFEGRQRISARTALAHPYFVRAGLLGSSFMQRMRLQIIRATQQERSENVTWVSSLMAKSGTKNAGGFTEAQLEKLREKEPRQKGSIQRNALASALRVKRKVSRTIDSTINDIRKERGMKRVNWWNRWET